ncbi:ABC transporter substrate-binding protein [Bradyrhizobium sp. ISRA443]|uniref:ABC transporter substrate-binding protein n=1 Tax=unclassified Bradyrhizobium TaxID=2631580 RepID=UPI0024790364|nr:MULTISPECIES: ABC transporter substrate-binding protein [unclassified Bradyrhizobium]WGR93426.1 ABC transporter substrate-binding protein [Bradyrhizobium sp. ISRA435]WGR97969.1 ABC transporter substrate-binding protein [Bradyrhizobium sp. ISRA436]WGS04859.1 ABC transporter substrate-binding protein [Bradyrhizobium sp. ISRA437]WGS11740.1 ABC transporter substrate-binding protein [Bradyrhizobium sp. ISRA443]
MSGNRSTCSRRSFLTAAAAVVAPPMVTRPSRAAVKSGSVTFTAYGGSYQQLLEKYVLGPFTEETGIKVNVVPGPELAKVKAQLLTGNVEWDIYTGAGARAAVGSKQGFWEKLDPSLFDVDDLIVPPKSDWVTVDVYAEGIAWDPKKYRPGKHPSNFPEYFDPKTFPGRRALRDAAVYALEPALLGDGVAPKDMYPLDLDRAFKALDRIKSNMVKVATTPQTISLVQTGEVDFSYTYVNRVRATNEPGNATPLAFSFEQNLIYRDAMAVLKNAPNKENAMKLVAYFLRPNVQARFYDHAGDVPVSRRARQMLSPETQKWQFDLNNPNNLIVNDDYWADNLDAAERRFKEWISS